MQIRELTSRWNHIQVGWENCKERDLWGKIKENQISFVQARMSKIFIFLYMGVYINVYMKAYIWKVRQKKLEYKRLELNIGTNIFHFEKNWNTVMGCLIPLGM